MPKAKAQRPSARSATGKGKVSAAGASGSLASVCSNGGPAPAPAAQRATTRPAPPGRTQLAIRRLLAFDLGQVDFGRMVSVITDRHMRPPNLSAEQLALEPAKTCCFDAAGGASPSWTAHELCDSCTLYNQFIQVSIDPQFASIIKRNLDSARVQSNCASDLERAGALSGLPVEVVAKIMGHYADDLVRNRDYATLRHFMHRSSITRYAAAQALTPLDVDFVSQTECTDALRIPASTSLYIDEAIRWFLADFSVRKHGSRPALPQYGKRILSTVSGSRNSNILCCPPMTMLALSYGNAEEEESKCDHGSNIRYDEPGDYAIEEDFCEVTRDALEKTLDIESKWGKQTGAKSKVSGGLDEESQYWARWARFANPFQRALWYEKGYTHPVVGLRIKFQYWLHDEEPDENDLHPHVWDNAAKRNKVCRYRVFSAP